MYELKYQIEDSKYKTVKFKQIIAKLKLSSPIT
jgi:hypothetical protein